MKPTDDEAGRQQGSAMAEDAVRLYESVGGPVLDALTGKFRLSLEDARTLLSGVCVQAMMQGVRNPEAWTVGMACHGAKDLQRRHDEGTAAPPPDITVEEIEALREVVLVGKALATITKKAREALRLRFREHRSYAEIAAELDITQQYAKELVFRSLQQLRAGQSAEDGEQDR